MANELLYGSILPRKRAGHMGGPAIYMDQSSLHGYNFFVKPKVKRFVSPCTKTTGVLVAHEHSTGERFFFKKGEKRRIIDIE